MEHFFSKWDARLIAATAILCLLLLWPRGETDGVTADVYVDGEVLHRIALDSVSAPYEIPLDTDPPAVLLIEPGRIRYQSADCPDKVCVRCGWLSRPGDTAACLPGRSMVVLSGGERVFMTY